MSRLPAITSKKLIKKLKKIGFIEDHITGSHVIMYEPKSGKRVVVPYHIRDISKGTLNSLLKEAGIDRSEILR